MTAFRRLPGHQGRNPGLLAGYRASQLGQARNGLPVLTASLRPRDHPGEAQAGGGSGSLPRPARVRGLPGEVLSAGDGSGVDK